MRARLRARSRRYAGPVDVLSDVVAAMRTGRAHSARARRPASFGRWFPPADAAGFHIVVRGSCWLFPADGAPLALGAGDVAFLPHGAAHGLADNPSTPMADSSVAAPPGGQDGGQDGKDGTGGTILLCGAYLLDRSRTHPLLGDLPQVIHVPASSSRHPQLTAAVELLDAELALSRPGSDAMVPALLEVLLLHILRAWFDDQDSDQDRRGAATGWALALRDPAISAALRAAHGDPDRPWTVEELGARAGLSRAAFSRRFTALVGQPPLGYLT